MSGRRRARGEGAIYWEESRRRWVAWSTWATTARDAAYDGTCEAAKTEAQPTLRVALRARDDGVVVESPS